MALFNNILGSIFLIISVMGCLVSIALCFKKGYLSKNWLILLLLLLYSYELFFNVSYWSGWLKSWVHLNGTTAFFPVLYGPLLFLYMKKKVLKLTKSDFLMHLAVVIICFLYFLPFFIQSKEIKLALFSGAKEINFIFPYLTKKLFYPSGLYYFSLLTQLGSTIFYCIQLNKLQLRENKMLNISSDFQIFEKNILFKNITLNFVLYTFALLAYHILSFFSAIKSDYDYAISIIMTVLILNLIRLLLLTDNNYSTNTITESEDTNTISEINLTAKSRVSDTFLITQKEMLIKVMELEKHYLKPNLKITDLAKILNINSYQLSILINSQFKMSFNEFINRKRIEYACTMLNDQKTNDKLIKIASDAGFTNKTSFINSFKKYTGYTPVEYKKNIATKDFSN